MKSTLRSLVRFYILFLLVLGFNTSFSAQNDQANEEIGVQEGEIYTYQITNILNFQNVPLFVGENGEEIKTELGDIVRLKIVNTELTTNAEIELEIQLNDGQTIQYFNKMDTFDLIVFTDWDYWRDLLIEFNMIFEETDEFFEVQFAFEDDGFIYYLVTRYDKQTGVFIYQLIYVTLDGLFETPVGYIEIVQGDPLPVPDKTQINVSLTDFYQFELTQLVGYDDDVVLNGTDGELTGKEGDILEVFVANRNLGQNRELLLAVKNGDQGISFLNRMDFLGSIYDIPFFVFTDWEYMSQLVDYYADEASDIHDISYEITEKNFVYYEEYANESEMYYNIELHYDLLSGVLNYEAFYLENLTHPHTSVIEINRLPSVTVDKSLSISNQTEFLFRVEEFQVEELQPIITTSDGNIWLFEGDIFEIVLSEIEERDDRARMQLLSNTQLIYFNNSLSSLGEFAVYPDWAYWDKFVDFMKDYTENNTEIAVMQNSESYTFSITIQDNVTNYNYSTVYEKSTGVIQELTVDYVITRDNDTSDFNLLVQRYDGPRPEFDVDMNQTLITLDTITPNEESTDDDSNGIGLIATIIGLVFIRAFKRKSKFVD